MSLRAITRPATRRGSPASSPGSTRSASTRRAAISSRSGNLLGRAIARESKRQPLKTGSDPVTHAEPHRRGGGLCSPPLRSAGLKASEISRHGRAQRGRTFLGYAALISRILYFRALPRGVCTSTVSPFFLPRIALPTGDSFESLF